MNIEQLKSNLDSKFVNAIEWLEDPFMLCCKTNPTSLHSLIQSLYQEEGFQFLTDITGVHYPDRIGEEFEAVYHLHNLTENIRIKVKVPLSIHSLTIPSIVDIYSGANWMERETYDFFGIEFENHPNLTRILNADDMTIHPMRKEYPMEDPTRMDKDDEMFGRG